MDGIDQAVQRLRVQISAVEDALSGLKAQLIVAEQSSSRLPIKQPNWASYDMEVQCHGMMNNNQKYPLELEEYKRYGRQMIMPEVGIDGRSAFALSTYGVRWSSSYMVLQDKCA